MNHELPGGAVTRHDPANSNEQESIVGWNQSAWDAQVRRGNRWTVPVTAEQVERARAGDCEIVLTPQRPVPAEWLGNLRGVDVLCLASGGGQQGPLLAAAGARVTVADFSESQLDQDRLVAQRENLEIATIRCDMRDLHPVPDAAFDLVVHPCSNAFVPGVLPVWKEAFRVLRRGGRLISGWIQPHVFLFEPDDAASAGWTVRYRLPYADCDQLSPGQLEKFRSREEPLWFGHTLTDQIGGQLAAGFLLQGMYEDHWREAPWDQLDQHIASFAATLAIKPATSSALRAVTAPAV